MYEIVVVAVTTVDSCFCSTDTRLVKVLRRNVMFGICKQTNETQLNVICHFFFIHILLCMYVTQLHAEIYLNTFTSWPIGQRIQKSTARSFSICISDGLEVFHLLYCHGRVLHRKLCVTTRYISSWLGSLLDPLPSFPYPVGRKQNSRPGSGGQ